MHKWKGYLACGHQFIDIRPPSMPPTEGEMRMCTQHGDKPIKATCHYEFLEVDNFAGTNA